MADVFYAEDKQPGEVKTYAIEYAGKLDTGETLVSIESAVAIRVDTGADVTSDLISGTVINGTKLKITIKDGITKIQYKISTRVVTSTGNKFDADLFVSVLEY